MPVSKERAPRSCSLPFDRLSSLGGPRTKLVAQRQAAPHRWLSSRRPSLRSGQASPPETRIFTFHLMHDDVR
eukprot:2530798-Rhodomonas_salina.1